MAHDDAPKAFRTRSPGWSLSLSWSPMLNYPMFTPGLRKSDKDGRPWRTARGAALRVGTPSGTEAAICPAPLNSIAQRLLHRIEVQFPVGSPDPQHAWN